MQSPFYVYLHCTPDGTPFYVGKGHGWRARCFGNRNLYHQRIVKKFGRENIQIFVFLCESEQQALQDEVQHIAQLRNEGYPLTNMTDGGEGTSGFKLSESTIEKLRAINRGNKYNLGKKQSAETKAKRAAALRGNQWNVGKKMSPEARARHAARLTGIHHADAFELRITDSLKKQLVNDYVSGMGLLPLAAKNHADYKAVRRILTSEGVVIRRRGYTAPTR